MNSTLIFTTLGTIVAGVLTAMIIYWLKKPSLNDKDRFDFYRFVFNRPAFKGMFTWHSDINEFKQAIDEIMKALNTGHFTTFDDKPDPKRGISKIHKEEWRAAMENVTSDLQNIKQILQNNASPFEKADVIDKLRDKSIIEINKILTELKIDTLKIPTEVKTYNEAFGINH